MKSLTLLRHAKAGWNNPSQRDFDRPLDERGRRAAPRMGFYLRTEGLAFDRVLVSPSVRTLETLALVEEGYGAKLAEIEDERVYLASSDTLLDLIHDLPDEWGSILIVGHNPGFEDLGMLLAGQGPARLMALLAAFLPTAGVVSLAFDVDHWADIRPGEGMLVRFTRPVDLDRSLDGD
ncbi:SixA phosphatase family protein [Pedomonas mirosovicensis]|uniref:SixA phosphatase family protein n=1 Tax=Pedomonas mirosovicensis TaxID=2908641 RepID=UPI002167AB1A|nr:histidine phosphatase family protein [Pedomonas mirosovicensis]MCH8683951.1 histidine phosphatase family protein [Pedomonas mirosovicensis]